MTLFVPCVLGEFCFVEIQARHDYLCVAGCAHGSGDQYFFKATLGDDPPLIQVDHEARFDADLPIEDGLVEIVPALSTFFASAKTCLK